MPRRKRRTFTEQQKAEAKIWRQSGKTLAEVARDLDLTENSLRQWASQAKIDERGPPPTRSSC